MFVSAILQDATLSVKIASNMLEREIFNVGSREGLVGCATPSFVSRAGLLQVVTFLLKNLNGPNQN